MARASMRVEGMAGLVGGLVGGLAGAATSLLLQSERGTLILPEIATEAATDILPPEGFSFLLRNLGSDGKPLLFFGVLLAQILVYGAMAVVTGQTASRWARGRPRGAEEGARGTLLVLAPVAMFLLVSAILIWSTAAAMPSRTSWGAYTLGLLAAAAVFAIVAGALRSAWSRPSAAGVVAGGGAEARVEAAWAERITRRGFLGWMGGLAVTVGGAVIVGQKVWGRRGGGAQVALGGMPTPEITPTKDFYVVSKNLFDRPVDAATWRLRVGGRTARLVELTLDDIRALPARDVFVTLQCISNEVGGDLISTARWRGCALRDVLAQAEPQADARFVAFHSYDDYSESLPLEFALRDSTMLVYEMNGAPLPDNHGFPLRLLSPGKYGIKHPKWITEIALLDQEILGYWQQRGWSQEARMKTTSRIDVPVRSLPVEAGPIRIHGLAFSGDRGIRRVEVSTDRGESWGEAVLRPPLSPYTWVLWHYDTEVVAENGRFPILARATDGSGALQPVTPKPPDPDGAQGWPAISVRVRAPRGGAEA